MEMSTRPLACVMLVFSISLFVRAQEAEKVADTTEAVRKALKTLYPEGEVTAITKEQKGRVRRFLAVVKDKAGEHKLTLRSDGSVVESRDPVETKTLPPAVVAEIKKRFPAGTISSVAKLAKYKAISYEVKVNDQTEKVVYLKEDGAEAPKVVEDEKEE